MVLRMTPIIVIDTTSSTSRVSIAVPVITVITSIASSTRWMIMAMPIIGITPWPVKNRCQSRAELPAPQPPDRDIHTVIRIAKTANEPDRLDIEYRFAVTLTISRDA